MTVRAFTYADRRHLMRIERACFPKDAWKWEDYKALLDDGGESLVAAAASGSVVGCIWWKGCEIVSVGVLPSARGQGVGDRLLLEALLRMGVLRAELDVRPGAVSALRLYLRHGFVPASYDPDYYGRGEGALHMIRYR